MQVRKYEDSPQVGRSGPWGFNPHSPTSPSYQEVERELVNRSLKVGESFEDLRRKMVGFESVGYKAAKELHAEDSQEQLAAELKLSAAAAAGEPALKPLPLERTDSARGSPEFRQAASTSQDGAVPSDDQQDTAPVQFRCAPARRCIRHAPWTFIALTLLCGGPAIVLKKKLMKYATRAHIQLTFYALTIHALKREPLARTMHGMQLNIFPQR